MARGFQEMDACYTLRIEDMTTSAIHIVYANHILSRFCGVDCYGEKGQSLLSSNEFTIGYKGLTFL
ncbi:unnamed protein product [Brassica napus]|uniref:(rape) hypothetical protein n=1 Tax=Brassica napus TaxID=3708 RepID=A0A816YTZ2_BRANA|nr:unnamed protein product [Brassica napus]